MARQRRGGFPAAPELRGTLGTLLRTTREILERGAREGRERLDEALSSRRRHDALADLGEIVLDLVRRGEIDLAELPEARDVIAHLDEIDRGTHVDARDDAMQGAVGTVRRRFDDRGHGADPDTDGTVSASTWKPPARRIDTAPPARSRDHDKADRDKARRPEATDTRPGASRGGITFDDDLADYMHPDDVPAKPRTGGSGDES
jgi:hypothetical protein